MNPRESDNEQCLVKLKDTEEEVKSRTPSGNILPNKVGDLRDYFSPKRKRSEESAVNSLEEIGVTGSSQLEPNIGANRVNQPRRKRFQKRPSVTSKTNTSEDQTPDEEWNETDSEGDDYSTPQNRSFEEHLSPSKELLSEIAKNMKHIPYEVFKRQMDNDTPNQSNEPETSGPETESTFENSFKGIAMEMDAVAQAMGSTAEQPKVVTLEMVYQMFTDLKKEFSANKDQSESKLNQKLEEVKKDCAEGAVQAVQELLDDEKEEKKKMKMDIAHYKHKTTVLTEVCDRLHTEISDLTQRIENLEIGATKKMAIMTGYMTIIGKKYEVIQELENFFERHLKVEIVIDDYFMLNSEDVKPIVIDFQTIQDKKQVMRFKNMLKDIRSGGRKIFINDYTPINVQEKRRREQKIQSDLEADPKTKQVQTAYTKKGFVVAGVPYKKAVSPPTPKELVDITVDQLQKIMNIPLRAGEQIRQEGSTFVAHSAPAQTHQEVRDMYKKMKLLYPTARHIVCIYSLPGQKHIAQDFHDDGEPGAGRVLLQVLQDYDIRSRAVFVIRHYGGVKLGAGRFDCYKTAMISAINSNAFNHLVQNSQNLPFDEIMTAGRKRWAGQNHHSAKQRSTQRVEHSTHKSSDMRNTQNIRGARHSTTRGAGHHNSGSRYPHNQQGAPPNRASIPGRGGSSSNRSPPPGTSPPGSSRREATSRQQQIQDSLNNARYQFSNPIQINDSRMDIELNTVM